MSTNDVLITPGSGEVKWVDSGGSDFVRIIGDAGATNTITFVGDDNTANGVIFQDHATDVFYPATSGLNLGVSANRWNLFATAGDFSGAITTATNITLSGASSLLAINGASATISMGGTAGLFTFSGGSSILLSGANSSITLTGLSSVLTLAGVTGTNLAPLKFTTGSAPGTSVAGQMWWTGSSNLQFAKTNGTASTFAFTDTDLSTFTVGILGVARGGTGTGTTFTLGSVVFAGASGVYTQDNANFFWDDTNNRLGIGTASPTSDLSLGGATAARTIALERKTSGAGSNLTIRSGGAQSGATDTAGGTLILSSGITTGQGFSYVDIYTYGDETVITGSSDNSSMPVARFGGAGIALGTTTIGSGLNLTLNSNVGVTPWTYAIGLPDSTSVGGNALTIKSGNATTASNISGGTLALVAGNATGTGSSSITFSTATAGTTGTTVRTSSTKITISGTAMSLSPHGTAAGSTFELGFLELAANGTNYLSFKAPDSIGTTVTHTLPSDVPAAGEALKVTSYSGGVAVLEWGSVASSLSIGGAITSGTTGSVLFVGASNDLQQDNANLFFDDTNNTLGVGTTRTGAISGTNPRLRVKGSGATSATSSFEAQDSAAVSLFLIRDDGLINFGTKGTYTESTGRVALTATGNTGGLLIGGDTNLYRGAADALYTDDSFFVNGTMTVSGGNVSVESGGLVVGSGGGGFTGYIQLLGDTSGTVTIQPQASAGIYNFNLPTTAGSSGDVLTSGGGGATAMTWTAPGALAVRWNSLANPTGNQSLTMSTHTTTWNWATGTSTNNLFNLTTDASANGTGALLRIATGASATVVPMLVVAAGTTALTVNASAQVLVNSLTSGRVTFAGTSGLLQDSANFTYTTGTGQMTLATTGSGAGILIGGDVQLYRIGANIMSMAASDSFEIPSGFFGVGTTAPTSATRVNITYNAAVFSGTERSVLFTGTVNAAHTGFYNITQSEGSTTNTTGTVNWIAGALNRIRLQSTGGVVTTAYGLHNMAWMDSASGTMTYSNNTGVQCEALWSNTAFTGTATVTNNIALNASNIHVTLAGGGTVNIGSEYGLLIQASVNTGIVVTTRYGIRVNDPTGSTGTLTTQYGLYFEDLDRAGTNYGIYFAGTSGLSRQGIWWNNDTNLYRSAADTLRTDDAFISGSTITGASSLTLGANGGTTGSILIRGTTSGTVTMTVAAAAGTWSFTLPTTAGSSGQYLQTNGSGVTSWQTLVGGMTWATNASSPISAVASNGYIANLGTLLTYNLPTPAVGSEIEIVGLGAGGWIAQCASTHTIRMGTTVSAATGYAASTSQYDSIRIIGVSATQWHIVDAVGTIDIV